jgi:hypothetical protein
MIGCAIEGGNIEHISSMPGLRNSTIVTGSPGLRHLFDDLGHALRRDLGLRDPDYVLVGHAQREVARDLAGEPPVRAGARVRFRDRGEAVEIEPGIG